MDKDDIIEKDLFQCALEHIPEKREIITKYWMALELFETNLFNQYEAIRLLHDNQESSLKKTIEEINNKISKDSFMKSEENEELWSHYDEVYHDTDARNFHLQSTQRFSMVVTIFSFLESQLKHLTNIIKNEFRFDVSASDLKGTDLGKYWKYLKKVYKIKNSTITDKYSYINDQKIIRNIIVHKGGFFPKEQLEDVEKFKFIKIVKNKDTYEIILDNTEYIGQLLDDVELFFKILLELCDQRYNDLK